MAPSTPAPTASGPTVTAEPTASSDAAGDKAVAEKVFAAGADRTVIGTATGTIVRQSGKQTAEILSVETGPAGTYLSWRLKSPDGKEQALTWVHGVAQLTENKPYGDLRSVRLTTATVTTTCPRRTTDGKCPSPAPTASARRCLRATPAGEGVELYGYYPALPVGVTSVTVQIAGLPDIANVPVTKVG